MRSQATTSHAKAEFHMASHCAGSCDGEVWVPFWLGCAQRTRPGPAHLVYPDACTPRLRDSCVFASATATQTNADYECDAACPLAKGQSSIAMLLDRARSNGSGASGHVAPFRKFVPQPGNPKRDQLPHCDAHQWGEQRSTKEPIIAGWVARWKQLSSEPYKGITTDGQPIPGLFPLAQDSEDEGAPTAAMLEAAQKVLSTASETERTALSYDIDSPQWRSWMNPEIYIFKSGVRLEESSQSLVQAIHGLLRASLSPSGYQKCLGCMKTNAFLGKLCHGEKVMNEDSYNFVLFGDPSLKAPWGWQLYGHHLVLNALVVGSQLVMTPIFMGAEPNFIDEGADGDVLLFAEQETLGLSLIRSLDAELRNKAIVYYQLHDPAMPEWRYHKADQRHLGGAFQDNRIIPYEGVSVSELSVDQQKTVQRLLRLNLDYLPKPALDVKMAQIEEHWKDTFFAWIGGFGDEDAFYYKVHGPVIMIEFDHHSGVFLTNQQPEKFHIHTLVRTPNGGDYGKELVKAWKKRQS